jgi:hypothetical protein
MGKGMEDFTYSKNSGSRMERKGKDYNYCNI